jgi:zinc transporter ZupT
MSFGSVLLLGFIAGATILLGLPAGRLKSFNPTLRSFLSMLAAGILVFLLVEILGDAGGDAAESLKNPEKLGTGIILALLLAGGLAIGLLGLVWFEQRLLRGRKDGGPETLSFMIATAIGLHNLSEGLAIGQSFAQGLRGMTVTLIIGFGLHNATEGFGIVGPVVQQGKRFSWGSLLLLALIGGGPTFVGTLLGSLWSSTYLSVAVLGMAGGALVYVVKELFAGVRKESRQVVVMTAVVVGFVIGWVTDVIASGGAA